MEQLNECNNEQKVDNEDNNEIYNENEILKDLDFNEINLL